MSQEETKPWVLASSINKDADVQDLQRISPQVSQLVDDWHSKGKIMWSGAFEFAEKLYEKKPEKLLVFKKFFELAMKKIS